MASTSRWKCLLRPSMSPLYSNTALYRSPAVAFSTTTTLKKSPLMKKKNSIVDTRSRQGSSLRLKKGATPTKSGKAVASGERKAIRKRIILSNTNALEVMGMSDVTPTIGGADIGKVLGLPGPVVDQLRISEAFKPTQAWGMFRRPGYLVRSETLEVMNMMAAAEAEKKTTRTVLDGTRGVGKSVLLLQTQAHAFLKGWIVIHIPEAQDLTIARTPYAPLPDTNPKLYTQNVYIAALLERIHKANEAVLSKFTISKDHKELPIPLQSNISLARLAELGARDPDIAHPMFHALWSELMAPGRPPLLLSVDGLQHIMKESAYRSADFQLIHAHDLSLVKFFTEHLSGKEELSNGGCVIAALTKSNCPRSASVDLAIQQRIDAQEGKELTKGDAWIPYDARVLEVLKTVDVIQLQGLNKSEARGLMEYWAASGVLRSRVDEKTVTESWALAGSGIIGELERGTLKMQL